MPVPRPLPLPEGVGEAASLHCSSESSVLVGRDGSVWTSGWNEHGNLGLGHTDDSHTWTKVQLPPTAFVAAGGAHVLAIEQVEEEPLLLPK